MAVFLCSIHGPPTSEEEWALFRPYFQNVTTTRLRAMMRQMAKTDELEDLGCVANHFTTTELEAIAGPYHWPRIKRRWVTEFEKE